MNNELARLKQEGGGSDETQHSTCAYVTVVFLSCGNFIFTHNSKSREMQTLTIVSNDALAIRFGSGLWLEYLKSCEGLV